MSKKKEAKAGTKNVPPPTTAEAPSRVTADTVVTEGGEGMARLRVLTRQIMERTTGSSGSSPEV